MSVARIKDPMVERKPSVDENSKGLNEKIRKYYRHEEYAEKYRKEKLGV